MSSREFVGQRLQFMAPHTDIGNERRGICSEFHRSRVFPMGIPNADETTDQSGEEALRGAGLAGADSEMRSGSCGLRKKAQS